MRRYLAYRPEEVSRVYRLIAAAPEGCSGHGPAHLLVESAAEVGFSSCSQVFGWIRPGLPVLDMVAGPIQHFRSAILDAWRHRVSMDLCSRKGFRGGPFLDVSGTLQLLNSDHVREGDKALLRGVLVGGVWNGFLLVKVRNCHVPCRFCGGDDHDGHLFWDCPFPPLVEIRENPEFHELMEMDKSFWPRCLLWHGWLLLLSGANLGSPWALSLAEGASNLLEVALGSYSSALLLHWHLPDGFDAESAAQGVAKEPDVWTDGSMVEDKVSGSSSAGAGFSTGRSDRLWAERSWGHIDDGVQGNGIVSSCRGYCSTPGPLQYVLLCLRGFDTVRISKVKGHANEDMVVDGRVRDLDLLGNRAADEAADFGRRRVPDHVVDARRNLVGVCNRWYPVVRHLHGFFLMLLLRSLLILMVAVVLRRTLLFGVLVLCPKGPRLLMLFVTLPFCLVPLVSGMVVGFLLL